MRFKFVYIGILRDNPTVIIVTAEDIEEAIYNFSKKSKSFSFSGLIKDFDYVDYGVWHGSPNGEVTVNYSTNYLYIIQEDSKMFNADLVWYLFKNLNTPESIFSQAKLNGKGKFFQKMLYNIAFKKQ